MKKKLDNETIQLAFEDITTICDNAQFDEEFSIYEEYLDKFDTIELALDELYERREMMQRLNEVCEPHIVEDEVYKKAKAFDIIKDFVWIENDEIHLGLYGDSEIVLKESDFESKEEYDLVREMLK